MASHAQLFVGREPELEQLTAALADAVAGSGSLCLVVGPPGVGGQGREATRSAAASAAAASSASSRVPKLW